MQLEERVVRRLAVCAGSGGGLSSARAALNAMAALDRDVLVRAAAMIDATPIDDRERVYELLAAVLGSLHADEG